MYFDREIPDYRLIGILNPDKTPETPDLSGLTRFYCILFKKLKLKGKIEIERERHGAFCIF